MMMRFNNQRSWGIRKAAILVASLDEPTANLLLDQLSTECADLVREAVLDIEEMDAEERREVIEEFRRIEALVPDPCPPGIELDSLPTCPMGQLTSLENEISIAAETVELTSAEATQPFAFLHSVQNEQLSELLTPERPQTIALVLSHLSPEQAGEVLLQFTPSLQVEIVRRLVDRENTDPETVREVEQALEIRLQRQSIAQHERSAGPRAVARILASCNNRVVEGIMTNLAAYDRPLAERLGCKTLEFGL